MLVRPNVCSYMRAFINACATFLISNSLLLTSSFLLLEYRNFVDFLQSIISMYAVNVIVIVMGNLNAHLQGTVIKSSHERGRYMQCMLHVDYHNLYGPSIASQIVWVLFQHLFPMVTFTKSPIDYILVPDTCLDTVSYCEILDDDVLNVSRHRPIVCEICY